MEQSKVIADYTYLWYDVRPHPQFGTVEIRVMDSQTRLEHTLGLAALVQAMVKELAEHFDSGEELSRYPYEMLDENKWLAARHGLEGELVDLPSRDRVRTKELAHRLIDRLRGHARGPRLGRRPRRASTTCSRTATAAPASWSSSRPTTTCARSWARSSRPAPRRARPA